MTLDELERLAKAATPGPWKSVGSDDADTSDRYGKEIVAAGITLLVSYPTLDIEHEQAIKDANYVAAANPAAVLAMIKRIERLEAAVRAAGHALRSYQYGNAATELAESIADRCDAALATGETK